MNIKDLENFYQIGQYKSFSFAAKMLGVTQPTLSESIKRLEAQIGSQLFYRSKQGIKLTPNGEEVLGHVKELLNLKNKIASITNTENTSLSYRLGCHPVVASYFFKNFLKKIMNKHSQLIINLEHNRSQDIQKEIQQGKIDIGVHLNGLKSR